MLKKSSIARCCTTGHCCVLLSEKAAKLTVIQASGSEEINSLDDHPHDGIHLNDLYHCKTQ